MAPLEASGENAEQIRYWNETAGPKWVEFQALVDAQIAHLGEHAMDRAGLAPGERVIDVGCGCGETTLALARRVAPAGQVLGVDLSAPMLARAAERARAAGLGDVIRFENADAQTHRLPAGAFDVAYSRFGVMFFADPAAAFANLRTTLRPGGRLAFVCWQTLVQNRWLSTPLAAAAPHLTLPPPPAPGAPGPFSLADPDRVRSILGRAGFADVALEPVCEPLTIGGGGDVEATVRFLLEGVGPTSAALRDADPAVRERVGVAVREAIAPYVTPTGVRMDSAAWIVTARG